MYMKFRASVSLTWAVIRTQELRLPSIQRVAIPLSCRININMHCSIGAAHASRRNQKLQFGVSALGTGKGEKEKRITFVTSTPGTYYYLEQ